MADLLLELFSEEIPAGMQTRAGEDLQRLVCDGLKEAGLDFKGAKNFAGPRRLTLVVEGLPEKSADVSEERKGPRVGSPDKAIQGFLRGAGLESIDQADVVSDEKKGDFYVARIEKPGRATADIIAEVVPIVLYDFPWPKSMRWGEIRSGFSSAFDSGFDRGSLRWVRPLHSIICLFGGETVPFEVDGIRSGNETRGHRFMAPDAFTVKDFADYEKKLRAAHVILDAGERRKLILEGAQAAAKKAGLDLVGDEALLAENAGLVEWPVVLMGAFDKDFLNMPPEVIVTAIRKHQKCFSLKQPSYESSLPESLVDRPIIGFLTSASLNEDFVAEADIPPTLANKFILVSNLVAEDGGRAIVEGNERVIRARLSDAKFFWDQDRKIKLKDRLPELKDIIFQQKFEDEFTHPKVGSQFARVERLVKFSERIADAIGADVSNTKKAASLSKADLVTGMVGEFPDLQGQMGKYYALDQGEDASVAAAIEEHYRPLGPNDSVASGPVSIAVALADKLDTLVGFWAIDEKPTGSKDPYALRRAALGVLRSILENQVRLSLKPLIIDGFAYYGDVRGAGHIRDLPDDWDNLPVQERGKWIASAIANDLLAFFHDRLKVYLRDRGARHDLIDAVISPDADDLLMIVDRVEALGKFLDTDDGANLLTGVDRATSILRIEEKKDGEPYDGAPDAKLLKDKEEKALAKAIDEASKAASAAVEKEDFEGAMAAMAKLRKPVDDFFDNVTVNADDPKLRENRLKLLNRIREATLAVADFSKIAG